MIDSFTSTWKKKSINVTHTLKISASTRNNRSPVKKKKKKSTALLWKILATRREPKQTIFRGWPHRKCIKIFCINRKSDFLFMSPVLLFFIHKQLWKTFLMLWFLVLFIILKLSKKSQRKVEITDLTSSGNMWCVARFCNHCTN